MAAVNILNAGINESTVTYDANEIASLDLTERLNVFTSVSVTPTIKTEGLLTVANKSFIEIRKTATFSTDTAGAAISGSFHNRLYPASTDLDARAKNKEETKPFRIKTFDSDEGGSNSTTNAKFSYVGTANQLDLEDYDYFVLINPEIVGEANTTVIKPHFARITAIVGFDEFGDGIEFEPAYPTVIPKDTNFEIYKGPAKTETSVVAVSYGLEGDANISTNKYDVVNTISIPTAYFYNERLHEDNQLDYETKYAFLYKNKNASTETDQNSWFMTEAKFNRTIQNLGRKTLDATLVDNTKDTAADYQPLVQDGFLNSFYRDNDGDVRRFLYFDKREFKNSRIPTVIQITTNAPKNRISKFANVKFTDSAGIAHLKYSEEDDLYIRNGIYNSSITSIKAPYNATHGAGNKIEILSMGEEYDMKAILTTDSMIEVDGYHYIVDTVEDKAASGGTQFITTKNRKLITDNEFPSTGTNTVHQFTNKEVRYAPFTKSVSGKHRLNTTFASDTKVKVDQSDRITIDGRTIAKENTTIYKSKLSTANNTSFYIDLEKGDAIHKYIEFADNTTNYYQSDYPFMYYLSGGYTIHETVFEGFIEDTESKNESGLLSFQITGRDEIGDLLSKNITRNLNYLNDIVYSTSNPTVESGSSNFTSGTINGSANISLGDPSFITTTNLSVSEGDLVYNTSNDLIGEVESVAVSNPPSTTTTITLVMPALATTSGSSVRIYKDTKHISGLKALSSNTLETTRTTDFSSISGKGLVYSTGKTTTGGDLVSTSDTGSYSADGTLGYHISRTDSINGDSTHLLSVGTDDGFESVFQVNRTFNIENLSVVDIENIDDNSNRVRLAPSLPVVLGRLDNGKFYHLNTNIPLGGYLHKLVNNSPDSPKSEDFYRYFNANRFNPGTLNYDSSSVYADASSRTQKISGFSDLLHFSDDVSSVTSNYTTSSNSSSALTPIIATGANHVPKEIYYSSGMRENDLSGLTQVDRRTIPYELYGLGDILPFSYKRANSLGRSAQGMTNFGLMFEDEKVGTGSEITHTNYVERTKYRTKSDRNYDFSTISSASIDTNQMRRWGVMRLVEATFDWHFNALDAESIPKTSEIGKVSYPLYHRYRFDGSNILAGRDTDGNLNFDGNQTFASGDVLYNSLGRIIAVFNASFSDTTITAADLSAGTFTSYNNVGLLTEDDNNQTDILKKVVLNTSRIVHDDGNGLNGNDDTGTFVYIDNFTEFYTNGKTLQTLLDVHHLVPRIDRDYLDYVNLSELEQPNVVLPFFARFDTAITTIGSGTNSDDYPSLYPVNRMTNTFIHTSRVLHAILHTKPNFSHGNQGYESHALTHYDFAGGVHLYQNCRLSFKDFKSGLARTNDKTKPTLTSSDVDSNNVTGTTHFTDIASHYPSQTLFMIGYGNSTGSHSITGYQERTFVAPMTRTTTFVNQKLGSSYYTETTATTPKVTSDGNGQVYRSQMFVKPILTLSSSEAQSTTVDKVMNSSTDALWLEFVPNLTGYYLVRDFDGTTTQIAKITNHTRTVSNNVATHALTFDRSIMAADYRLMRVAETTLEDTPNKIQFNKLFNTGLQYDIEPQDMRFSESKDERSKYQEGILSMFLFIDIDNLDDDDQQHIDRRIITELDDVFTNGEQIQVYVTDGKTKTEKTVTIDTTGNDFSISYDGTLSGDGVVSFGEIFEVVIPKRLNIDPVNAYLGTTFSIGSEIDTEIADVLKEVDLDINAEQSLRDYTGAIVNSGNSGTNQISYTGTTDIAIDDVLYTHEGYLLGKVSAITSTTITFDSREFIPAQYDEIIRRNKKTFISLANFNDVDAFSVINYLASKKGLDYTIENKSMNIKRLDDLYGLRTYQLDYLTSNTITSVDSNKSLFDKANKVIVIGDAIRAEAEFPTRRKTKEVVVVEPNIKSLNDARIKAEQTLKTLQTDARKIKIQVQKEGIELIKPGDIVSLDFPNHDIPKGDYQVFEIENSLTSLLTLSVNTFNKSIAERLSELGVEQRVGIGKILTRNSEQEIIGKLFFDTVNINNISVKYQISRNENALGLNNTLGFNSQLGLDITDETPHITERDE